MMPRWLKLLGRTALSGTGASIACGSALAWAARAEGRGALQPIDASSHWLHGPMAADRRSPDLTHMGIGYATHHAANLFWAGMFELWMDRRRPIRPVPLARDAAVMAAVAAAVDYLATPARFTPGWELVLSRKRMAFAYAALGAG